MSEQKRLLRELEQDLDRELLPLSELIATSQNSLLSKEMQLQRIQDEIRMKSLLFRQKSAKGLEFCLASLEEMAAIDDSIKVGDLKESLKSAFAKLATKEQAESMAAQVIDGNCWKDLLAIPTSTMQLLYKAAKKLLEEGHFEQAECAFSHLILLDHTQYCFWLGLGACSFRQQNYDQGLIAYQTASEIAPREVWPHIFQAECFDAKSDFEKARDCFTKAALLYHEGGKFDQAIELRLKVRS